MPKVIITLDCHTGLQAEIINHVRAVMQSHSNRGCVAIKDSDYAVQKASVQSGDVLVIHSEAGFGKMNTAIVKDLELTATA